MPYRWEPTAGVSGRYRDERGRFVASSTVRRELDRYLDTADPAKALAEALRGRQLSLADWETAFRRHVKNTHLNAIAMERGGWANMTPSDYGRAGQIIREQYGYLRGFANDIASGKQRLDGTLGTRARLYTQAGRETFYRSKHEHLAAGIDMVGSVRSARDSCSECIALDGKWFRVGDPAYKLPGQRICTKSCRCYERYGRMTADGVVAVEEGEGARLAERETSTDMADMVDLLTDADWARLEQERQQISQGDPVALAKSLAQVEPHIAKLKDYEVAYVFDSKGQLLIQKKGEAHSVSFTKEDMRGWQWGTITHNHPGGNSFSRDDVNMLSSGKMRSMRAVGIKNGRRVTYELTVIDEEFYPNWYRVPMRYSMAEDDIYEEIDPLFKSGAITSEEAAEMHAHRTAERFVERMEMSIGKPVLRYTRTYEE